MGNSLSDTNHGWQCDPLDVGLNAFPESLGPGNGEASVSFIDAKLLRRLWGELVLVSSREAPTLLFVVMVRALVRGVQRHGSGMDNRTGKKVGRGREMT